MKLRINILLFIALAPLLDPALAHGDIALLVANGHSHSSLWAHATGDGFHPVELRSGPYRSGMAPLLGIHAPSLCHGHVTHIMAINFSPPRQVAGPIACGTPAMDAAAQQSESAWEATLRSWKDAVNERLPIWLSAVLSRSYESIGAAHCEHGRLSSALSRPVLSRLSDDARQVADFDLTLCATPSGGQVATFGDAAVLIAVLENQGAGGLVQAIGDARPSLAYMVARLVLLRAMTNKTQLSLTFSSAKWRTSCTLTVSGSARVPSGVRATCASTSKGVTVGSAMDLNMRSQSSFSRLNTQTGAPLPASFSNGVPIAAMLPSPSVMDIAVLQGGNCTLTAGGGTRPFSGTALQIQEGIIDVINSSVGGPPSHGRLPFYYMPADAQPASKTCYFWFERPVTVDRSSGCTFRPIMSMIVDAYEADCPCQDIYQSFARASWLARI